MANLWKNEKQFKIIEMTWKEYVAVTDTFGLCNICSNNSSEDPIYYVGIINSWLCKTCLNAYLKDAKRYKGDFHKEQENFIQIRNKLIDLGTWEND